MELEQVELVKTDRTRKNIKKTLKNRLKYKYGKGALANSILSIHGMETSQFDFIGNIDKGYHNAVEGNTLNDLSIDDNSNKSSITFEALIQEATNPFRKIYGYDKLYIQMVDMYGKERARELSARMYDMSIAIHDSTRLDRVYCWALDSSSLLTYGRDFTVVPSGPAKRLQSYVANLCGLIHTISGSGIAGACAVGDFFICSAKTCLQEGFSIEDVRLNETIRKQIENTFQNFIYDVNDVTRATYESPFTNVSIFDRPKIKGILKEVRHLFPYEEQDDFIAEYVIELQKIYMDLFDKGIPELGGLPFTFPVTTVNFTKSDDEQAIVDQEYKKDICKYNIYRYNMFASKGSKVASCCFHYHQEVKIKQIENGEESIGNIPIGELVNIFDDCKTGTSFKIYHKGEWKDFKPVKVEHSDKLYHIQSYTYGKQYDLYVTGDHIFPTPDGDKKVEDLKVDDFLIVYHKNDCIEHIGIDAVDRISNGLKYVYCVEVDEEDPYFTLANGIITHNCRLLSDNDMLDLASQTNSFGGVSSSLGSGRVATTNLPRLAIEAESMDQFYSELDTMLIDTADILKAHMEFIKATADQGMQPFIDNGIINIGRLFSTFGLIGIAECTELLKAKFGLKTDITADILKFYNTKAIKYGQERGLKPNIEQVPGESLAVKLAKIDRMLFGKHKQPYTMYSNQFVPLWKESNIFDRMAEDGKYNKLLTGGGIVHIQLGEDITDEQKGMLLDYAVKSGCEHFAVNGVYHLCKDCGTLNFGNITCCAKCGGEEFTSYTRVVGFMTKVDSWNPTRREWEFPRRTFNTLSSKPDNRTRKEKFLDAQDKLYEDPKTILIGG